MRRGVITAVVALVLVAAPTTMIVGAQASSSGWTITPTLNPTAVGGQLKAVACPGTEECIAVGLSTDRNGNQVPLAEQWSGTSWSIEMTPRLVNLVGALEAVACSASSACTAAGYAYNSAGVRITLAERWNGHTWVIQPSPNPAGAGSSSFAGVACASMTTCTAVGSSTTSTGTPVTLAESWNGTSWTLESTPNPAGATSSALVAVACPSANVCSAVGSDATSTAWAGTNLAEQSAGNTWTIAATPTSASAGPLAGVSCAGPSLCFAVGRRNRNPATEAWNGIRWRVEPNALTHTALSSVSCAAANACMAAGNTAALWNGATWTSEPVASPPGAEGLFAGVSCSSATACTVVGSYYLGSRFQPIAERWSGTAWSIQDTPAPVSATYISTLSGVSCPSPTECIAVGFGTETNDGEAPLAEQWNGASWSMQSVPNPGAGVDASFNRLDGVSCVSADMCLAVGSSPDGAFDAQWNGKAWSIQIIPNTADSVFVSVSCTTPTACTAVGTTGANPNTVAAAVGQWNGTSWSIQTLPLPTGTAVTSLLGVSCSEVNACIAVGYGVPTAAPYEEAPLAEQWNGLSWSVLPTVNPAGSTFSQLNGVDCTATDCTAVGYSESPSTVSLAEQWNGSTWTLQPTPTPPVPNGSTFEGVLLDGVSCTTSDACTAAGSYSWGNAMSSGTSTLIDQWNGSAWTTQPSPNPIGWSYGVGLDSVSCTTSGACMAAGSQRNTTGYEVTLAEHAEG